MRRSFLGSLLALLGLLVLLNPSFAADQAKPGAKKTGGGRQKADRPVAD
jgi:hypothetical protein